jgi:hypothetical protein
LYSYLILFVALFFPNALLFADNLSCLICHESLKGTYVTGKGVESSLHVNGDKFASSVHGDLECTHCHLRYEDNPHSSPEEIADPELNHIAEAIAKKSPIDPVAQAACSQCHPDIYEEVKQSVHGANIFEKKEVDGALCLDCHGSPHEIVHAAGAGHDLEASPVAYGRIVETCGRCHEKKSVSLKYGFSTKIIERYDESFHGKKYHLGGSNLPVCTTCHGAHNIRAQNDPAAMVYGASKIELCGQCHAGANAKFVAAITHKPIGKDNPIPYYAEKGLILLTFLVISGCAIHIVLDIFSLIRQAAQVRRRRRNEVARNESSVAG